MAHHGKQPAVYGWRGEADAERQRKTYGIPTEYRWGFNYPVLWDGDLRPAPDIRWIVARLRRGPWYPDYGAETHSLNLELGLVHLELRMDQVVEKDPGAYWRALVEDEWRL